jgi:hypothetical protein
MGTKSVTTSVQIVWDDSVVIIFQFSDGDSTPYCGFVHVGFQAQTQWGSSTQINAILQLTQQQGIQLSNDPGTWVETVKYGARGNNQTIVITYDDSTSTPYTTQTGQPYDLQVLYSIAG